MEHVVFWLCGGVMDSVLRHHIYRYEMSAVLMIKNEASYVEEWLEFHRAVGYTKFYIYDNESKDNLREVLTPYIDSGIVEYIYYPGIGKQREIYTHAVRKFRLESKYMTFIDTDEFMIPLSEETIIDIVDDLFMRNGKAGAIGVNWRMFGDSGYEQRCGKLVTESFLHRAVDSWNENRAQCVVKFICNPRRIFHFEEVGELIYNCSCFGITEEGERIYGAWSSKPSFNKLQINHYWTRSKEEFVEKQLRGNSNTGAIGDKTWELYELYNRNEIYDDIAMRFWKDNIWHADHGVR